MVVPVSGDLNFFPVAKGKKNTGREADKVNFGDYLSTRVEPLDESLYSDEKKRDNRQYRRTLVPADQVVIDGLEKTDSQGSELDNEQSLPGRRIDLRA